MVRGVVALGESLVIGMKALSISAAQAAGEDEETGEDALSRTAIGLTLTLSLVDRGRAVLPAPALPHEDALRLRLRRRVLGRRGHHRLAIFLPYLWALSFMPDLRRVFQYHAAEHMAIHAYEAEEPIEAESASRFSQLHVRCGTAFLLIVMVVSIFVFAADRQARPLDHGDHPDGRRCRSSPGSPTRSIRWAGRNERQALRATVIMTPGLWLQHLTTRKPDIDHLEVACVALNRVLDLEADPPAWAAEVEVMA